MTAPFRTLSDLFKAFDTGGPGRLNDPGDGEDIIVNGWGQICSVTTTGGGETRILTAPTKPGILCAVTHDTDGGDFDLTVNPTSGTMYGYNRDLDTDINFADAGDYVVFYSIKVGTEYVWRAVAQEGTDAAVEEGTFDTLTVSGTATIATLNVTTGTIADANIPIQTSTTLAAEHGAGFIATSFAPRTSRRRVNGTIITEIKFDLDGLHVTGTVAKDVIGLVGAASSYIGKYVVADYGIVYRIEMICTVLPTQQTATIALDLDLGADDQVLAQDDTADDVLIDAGTVAAGQTYSTDVPSLTDNDYLYLIEGAGTDGTTGEYSGGQFIIRFFGHAVMT